MSKLSNEIKIGFLAILSIILLVWGLNYLKGSNLFDDSRRVYAIYSNIGGLQEGSGVSVNGFKVGFKIGFNIGFNHGFKVGISGSRVQKAVFKFR